MKITKPANPKRQRLKEQPSTPTERPPTYVVPSPAQDSSIRSDPSIVKMPSRGPNFVVTYRGEQRTLGNMKRPEINDWAREKARTLNNESLGEAMCVATIKDASALRLGPKASAEKRSVATKENIKKWRAEALARWIEEYKNPAEQPSTRDEMAKMIRDNPSGKRRPAIGTIGNRIKGVKAQAKREAAAQSQNKNRNT